MSKPTEFARQAENFTEEEWFEFLDEIDEVSRRRQRNAPAEIEPSGTNKDDVAAWVAKRHLLTDSSVREIWYLGTDAPPDEIRLLELNMRLGGTGWGIEPIEFATNINGASFKLLIADITDEEMTPLKKGDPSQLPPGWSLSEPKIWRRGE